MGELLVRCHGLETLEAQDKQLTIAKVSTTHNSHGAGEVLEDKHTRKIFRDVFDRTPRLERLHRCA